MDSRYSHIITRELDATAQNLADRPGLAETIFNDRFIGESPVQQDMWQPALRALMPNDAITSTFRKFLEAPHINDALVDSYRTYYDKFSSEATAEIWPEAKDELCFKPGHDNANKPLWQRLTRGDAVKALNVLAENPKIVLAVAGLHTFFECYTQTLRDLTRHYFMASGERVFARLGAGFDKVELTIGARNSNFFAGALAMHLALTHAHYAAADERLAGQYDAQDFARFIEHARDSRLFVRAAKEKTVRPVLCPFSRPVRMAAQHLWELYEKIPAMGGDYPGLKKSLDRACVDAASAFDLSLGDLSLRQVKAHRPGACPYHRAAGGMIEV